MSNAMIKVDKRASSAKHWRWMPGMLAMRPLGGGITSWLRAIAIEGGWLYYGGGRRILLDGLTPDLTDPATLGCLLALVREAWGRLGINTKRHPVLGWIVKDGAEDFLKPVACDTEAEALVAALEAAP